MPDELTIDTHRNHRIAAGRTNDTAEIFLLGAHTERYGDPEVVVWIDADQARTLGTHLLALADQLDS